MDYTGLGICALLSAFVGWLLARTIKHALKKAARLPEWHESLLADGDERMMTVPTAVVASIERPRWEREVREMLAQGEERDASDRDWHEW